VIRRLRDVLLIDLALVNAWHLIVAAGRYWSARRCVERARTDDTQAGALRGVEGHHTRVNPSPTGAASVRGASVPSAPAECPDCGAPIEHNRDLGYVTCSTGGPTHFYRWMSEGEAGR
jgi:hypothetical protein